MFDRFIYYRFLIFYFLNNIATQKLVKKKKKKNIETFFNRGMKSNMKYNYAKTLSDFIFFTNPSALAKSFVFS